jgi:hypothetical protein
MLLDKYRIHTQKGNIQKYSTPAPSPPTTEYEKTGALETYIHGDHSLFGFYNFFVLWKSVYSRRGVGPSV